MTQSRTRILKTIAYDDLTSLKNWDGCSYHPPHDLKLDLIVDNTTNDEL